MHLSRWSFHNIHMPMLALDDGTLCCTSQSLCSALNLKESALHKIRHTHRSEFDGRSLTESKAKEFIRTHQVEFGIRRVRSDMILWTEDDMILVAILSKSSVSKEFRKQLVAYVKKNATRDFVTKEEHQKLLDRMGALEELVAQVRPDLDSVASAAGTALEAQKRVRHLRLVPKVG